MLSGVENLAVKTFSVVVQPTISKPTSGVCAPVVAMRVSVVSMLVPSKTTVFSVFVVAEEVSNVAARVSVVTAKSSVATAEVSVVAAEVPIVAAEVAAELVGVDVGSRSLSSKVDAVDSVATKGFSVTSSSEFTTSARSSVVVGMGDVGAEEEELATDIVEV